MQQTLTDLLAKIESLRFSMSYTILSGFSLVKKALAEDITLYRLLAWLVESPEDTEQIYQRALLLLEDNPHPENMHPHDVAILGYLYVLMQVDQPLAQQAAERIRLRPRMFWARRLAEEIHENQLP